MKKENDKKINRGIDTNAAFELFTKDEGVVIDAWSDDTEIATTWKTYNDMGVELKEIEE